MERASSVILIQRKKRSTEHVINVQTETPQTEEFQAQMGDEGTAVCLLCDCGARYLVQDSSTRRRIRGDSDHNSRDKQLNKQVAAEVAARGVARVLVPSPCKK
ncbi:hypothetical protein PLESTB_001387000 [Pleodorina starrii]|uniref:Uncharacterized protein n=1 Tax=Pleodorina starrii TaxID=330485 RepID=A0A9W6BVE4_9CHLO|nr:hypothetical protein PLESTB_001387000 [Pleodorina starrii]